MYRLDSEEPWTTPGDLLPKTAGGRRLMSDNSDDDDDDFLSPPPPSPPPPSNVRYGSNEFTHQLHLVVKTAGSHCIEVRNIIALLSGTLLELDPLILGVP